MATYTEASVVSLASLEHIRLRAGMYIGRLGDGSQVEDGIYTLFKEVVDNAIDEFIMGYGKTISIFTDDSTITVRDSGRGIPLGKMIDCVSKINTGAKYTQDVFHFSVGLNGVGLKAVNALSEKFTVRSVRKKNTTTPHFTKEFCKIRDKDLRKILMEQKLPFLQTQRFSPILLSMMSF